MTTLRERLATGEEKARGQNSRAYATTERDEPGPELANAKARRRHGAAEAEHAQRAEQ